MYAELVIKIEESFRSKPYYCTEQIPTIGYGRVLGAKYSPLSNETTTKEKEIVFVRKRIQDIELAIQKQHPSAWAKCNDARKAILVSLGYQVGISGLFQFSKMWEALSKGDFETACKEMTNSKWFIQTKNRARRHIEQMRVGSLHMYYLTNGAMS